VATPGTLVRPAFRNDVGLELAAAALQLAGGPLLFRRDCEDDRMRNALEMAEQSAQ
jgi:hypothetical protein